MEVCITFNFILILYLSYVLLTHTSLTSPTFVLYSATQVHNPYNPYGHAGAALFGGGQPRQTGVQVTTIQGGGRAVGGGGVVVVGGAQPRTYTLDFTDLGCVVSVNFCSSKTDGA